MYGMTYLYLVKPSARDLQYLICMYDYDTLKANLMGRLDKDESVDHISSKKLIFLLYFFF